MKLYFQLIEYIIPLFAIYLVFKKGSLSIVYVPFLYFARQSLEKNNIVAVYHVLFLGLLFYYIFFHLPFIKRNIFSIILVFYYFILFSNIQVLKDVRGEIINTIWIFLCIPLIPEIFRNFSRERIFDELSQSAFLIMALYVFNALISTVLGYYPEGKGYGFTSGISFGNLALSIYNVLPLAIYVILRKGIRDKNVWYLGLYLVSIFLVFLTLRRTIMVMSVVATLFLMFELLNFKQLKEFIMYGLILSVVVTVVVLNTGFVEEISERAKARNLENRDIESEGRYLEYSLIYKDLFIYYEYSPWFGYGPFQSGGNYGKGIFGDRVLHTEFAHYVHASGFLGLMLYVIMVSVAFFTVWRKNLTREDKFQFFFLLFYFSAHFLLGWSRNLIPAVMFFSILNLPMAKANSKKPVYVRKSQKEFQYQG
jgi:hypothetical protein